MVERKKPYGEAGTKGAKSQDSIFEGLNKNQKMVRVKCVRNAWLVAGGHATTDLEVQKFNKAHKERAAEGLMATATTASSSTASTAAAKQPKLGGSKRAGADVSATSKRKKVEHLDSSDEDD